MNARPRSELVLRAAGGVLLDPPVEKRRRATRRPSDGAPPHGRDGGDRDGGGGGGGGNEGGEPTPEPARRPVRAAEFAFVFVLIGISSLFLTFLLAYVMLWRRASEWPPAGAPRAPDGLWFSTLLLLASSIALHAAGRARAGQRRAYVATLALGLAFLGAQAFLWRDLFRAGLTTDGNAYGALFYSLTGLHALHVVAGLAFLALVIAQRRPTETTRKLCALYWHFMGALWLVLFAVLYFV